MPALLHGPNSSGPSQFVQFLPRHDDEIRPSMLKPHHEYVCNVRLPWILELLEWNRNDCAEMPCCFAWFAGRCFDLHAAEVTIRITNDEYIIADIDFGNCNIVTANDEFSHDGKLSTTASIRRLFRHSRHLGNFSLGNGIVNLSSAHELYLPPGESCKHNCNLLPQATLQLLELGFRFVP